MKKIFFTSILIISSFSYAGNLSTLLNQSSGGGSGNAPNIGNTFSEGGDPFFCKLSAVAFEGFRLEQYVNNGSTCGASKICDNGLCIAGSPTTHPKRVFITSTTHQGDFGGATGADVLCQARAVAAGITGTFKAWVSDSLSSPSTRFTQVGKPYYTFNKAQAEIVTVANDWADLLDGSLDNGITSDENGDSSPGSVWTNTTEAGVFTGSSRSCYDWTVNTSNFTQSGMSTGTGLTSNWSTSSGYKGCALSKAFYCFEQ